MNFLIQPKKLLLLGLLSIHLYFVSAQDSLGLLLEQKQNMQREQQERWLKAGNYHITPFIRVIHTDSITKREPFSLGLPHQKELLFHIPDNFQFMELNGNQSIQAYLYNFTDSAVTLQRFDDALGFLAHHFMPDKEWVKANPLVMGLCGNGIWTQQLPPNHYLYLRIDNNHLIKGDKKVAYKMVLHINDQVQLESRSVDVKLFENQIKKIIQPQ